MPTLLEVVRLSTTFLADRGSESARLDAELLAAHALRLRRLDLYLQFDRPLAETDLVPIRELLRRRAQGEPVAYLTGVKEFHGRSFAVTPAVLIPRPETETLVERALAWARARAGDEGQGLRIADLGTGSGCIAVTVAAELSGCTVVASEVSPAAAAVARANVEDLGVGGRVEVVEGEWAEPLRAHAPFDMLLSNPPYVATGEMAALMRDVRDHEPRLALLAGADGMEAYHALVGGGAALLRDGGYVGLEIDPRRAAAVTALLRETWPAAEVVTVDDLTGRPRVVEARLPGTVRGMPATPGGAP